MSALFTTLVGVAKKFVAHPLGQFVLFLTFLYQVKEFYPFTHIPMYSDPEARAPYLYLADGEGNALGVNWRGNSFDDYAGYDMDRDGFGDIPYELRRLSSQLESTYPQLQFFRGAITLELLDAISSLFPMMEPETTLIDPRPRVGAPDWEAFDAR